MTTAEAVHMFEQKVVHHCAPTLAGLKPSNLFNCPALGLPAPEGARGCLSMHWAAVDACQQKIASSGITLSVLLQRQTGALILVYRPKAINRILAHDASRAFLQQQGYAVHSAQACIAHLKKRLEQSHCERTCDDCEFPHEVGLLLGYPYEDVMGFIAHGGKNDLCCGQWKVYTNEESARKTFNCFNRCRAVFDRKFAEGVPIEELARIKARCIA